ncbi:MAG: hypothetical protein GY938_27175 [Ketobacter sp.]|nr:hypothetical protein [Ketobacter sp.]
MSNDTIADILQSLVGQVARIEKKLDDLVNDVRQLRTDTANQAGDIRELETQTSINKKKRVSFTTTLQANTMPSLRR